MSFGFMLEQKEVKQNTTFSLLLTLSLYFTKPQWVHNVLWTLFRPDRVKRNI